MLKVKRFLSILFALFILSISLLPVSAAEVEQSENTVTIYFDNSFSQWETVKFYNNIIYDMLPVDGLNNIYYITIDNPTFTTGQFFGYISSDKFVCYSFNIITNNGKIFIPNAIKTDTNIYTGYWQNFNLPTEPATSESTTEPTTEEPTTEPATVPDYTDVTQISKYGFVAVVGILSMIVGMMSAKAFSFWKW